MLAAQILEELKGGGCGFLHCRAGLGRAPLLACTLLVQHGIGAEYAWKILAESRGQAVPDTAEQRAWVKPLRESVTNLDDALAKLIENESKG